jgi:hypothetical protein
MVFKQNASLFRQEIQKRNITQLIHFTPFENIAAIVGEGKILPRNKLHNISWEWSELPLVNAPQRRDNPSNLNTSIMHTNEYLLNKFRDKWYPGRKFCVIGIDCKYIYEKQTTFSTTNATYQVTMIGNDIQAFRRLFGEKVRSRLERNYVTMNRKDNLAPCYPTDPQAEVLIQSEIPYADIHFIACHNQFELDLLGSAFYVLGLPEEKLCVRPTLFKPQ